MAWCVWAASSDMSASLLLRWYSAGMIRFLAAWLVLSFGCGDDDGVTPRPDSGTPREDSGVVAPDAGSSDDGGASPDGGSSPAPDDLTALLEPIRADGDLPALAAAVFEGDQLLAIGATG